MPSPVRYPSGVSTAAKGSVLFNMPAPDPTKFYMEFEDFTKYLASDWTVTTVGASTVAKADAPFGVVTMTTAGAENDGVQIQKTGESFLLGAGKKAWFKTRFKISDATQSDFAVGLMVTDTTAIAASGDGVTDGVFFQKDDGSTSVTLYCQKNTTTGQTSAASVHTMVADTYVELGWEFDGVRYIKYFVNGVHKGTMDLTATLTTYLPDTDLTMTFAFLTGDAAAITANVDYMLAAIER